MSVVVRFAPSPTGYLHIGGGRTALFNYYFAKRHGGKFLLRIEDTDRERSTPEAVEAIFNGLRWLGIEHDGEATFQFERSPRHAEVARELVARGAAYYCYMTPHEIETERATAEANGTQWHYDRRWRDRDPATAPAGVKPVIRIKAPASDGALTLNDAVQGDVTVKYQQLDDFIVLRSDETPTYMLAVVVDDHDMDVTHVIRGDDHLNNMFRQYLIYQGMGWDFPIHAHVPLIHGPDGKKLSKRRNSAAIEEYRDMGYLPEAMRNYLLRLGWSHGDDEIISDKQACAWFDLEHIGKSPPQLDFDKLNHVNHHYIKECDAERLIALIEPIVTSRSYPHLIRPQDENLTPREQFLLSDIRQENYCIGDEQKSIIAKAINGLKERSNTLVELSDNAMLYIAMPKLTPEAAEKLQQPHAIDVLNCGIALATASPEYDGRQFIDTLLTTTGLKMGQVGPVLRASLTGTMQSPDMTEVITALGSNEVMKRLQKALDGLHS